MSLDMRQQDIGERRHTRFCTEEGMNPRNLANISLLTAGSDLGGPNDDEELWSLDATKLIRLAGVLRVEITGYEGWFATCCTGTNNYAVQPILRIFSVVQ